MARVISLLLGSSLEEYTVVWWYCGLVVLYHNSSQTSRVFLKGVSSE
jgi:hypothetical protein